MWFLKLLLVFALAGFLSAHSDDEMDECLEHLIKFVDAGDFESMCTFVPKTIKCVEDVLKKHTGLSLDELAKLAALDSTAARGATTLINFRSMLDDVCTEGSRPNMSVFMSGAGKEIDQCIENLDFEDMKNLFPEVDDTGVFCLDFVEFLDCVGDVVEKHTGLSVSDLATTAPQHSELEIGANLIQNLRSLMNDVCTKGTPLNTALAEHSECMGGVSDDGHCEREAQKSYEVHKQLEDTAENQARDDVDDVTKECMMKAYVYACRAAKMYEECGRSASDTYIQIIKRSCSFKYKLCSNESLKELKTNFAHSLDRENSNKNLIRLAFDLKKGEKIEKFDAFDILTHIFKTLNHR